MGLIEECCNGGYEYFACHHDIQFRLLMLLFFTNNRMLYRNIITSLTINMGRQLKASDSAGM